MSASSVHILQNFLSTLTDTESLETMEIATGFLFTGLEYTFLKSVRAWPK